MAEILPITPFKNPPRGTVEIPGSKSIANRALILGALKEESTHLKNLPDCEDVSLMIKALQNLGIRIDRNQKDVVIHGTGGKIPNKKATLEVGNAGTVLRFLIPLLTLCPEGNYELKGIALKKKRPVSSLLDALQKVQAITYSQETPGTLHLKTSGINTQSVEINAKESSQFLSALLLIAPFAEKLEKITNLSTHPSKPFIDLTLSLLHQFGHRVHTDGNTYLVDKKEVTNPLHTFSVEPDATAISYFAALIIAQKGGQLQFPGIPPLSFQGDWQFLSFLKPYGLEQNYQNNTLFLQYKKPAYTHPRTFNFNAISDTFLSLAAIAPLLEKPIEIRGIAHTRKQECDRIIVMAEALTKLGQTVEVFEDGMKITPQPINPSIIIETQEDHRVAMSLAILGTHDHLGNGKPWLQLKNPQCCGKSFPDFFTQLEMLERQTNAKEIYCHRN